VAALATVLFAAWISLGWVGEVWLRFLGVESVRSIKPEHYPDRLGDLRPYQNVLDATGAGPPFAARTNGQGFRGGAPTAVHPAAGTFRVLCLGDSFTFGAGVRDEEAFPAQLGAALSQAWPGRKIEVINAGVPFYDIGDALSYFREKGRLLKASVVVYQFYDDDLVTLTRAPFRTTGLVRRDVFHRVGSQLGQEELARRFLEVAGRFIPSSVFQWVKDSGAPAGTGQASAKPEVEADEAMRAVLQNAGERLDEANAALLAPVWGRYRALLAELDEEVRRSGGKLVLLIAPNVLQMDKPLDAPRRELVPFARERGVAVADLSLVFRRMRQQQGVEVFLAGNNHFNVTGNTLAAAELASFTRVVADETGKPMLDVVQAAPPPGLGLPVRVRLDPERRQFLSDSPLLEITGMSADNVDWRTIQDLALCIASPENASRVATLEFTVNSGRDMLSLRTVAFPYEGEFKGEGSAAIQVKAGGLPPDSLFATKDSPLPWNGVDSIMLDERLLPGGGRQASVRITLAGRGALAFNIPDDRGRAERRLEFTFYLDDS
jgi:hypothetical protein